MPYLVFGVLASLAYSSAVVLALPWISAMFWALTVLWVWRRVPRRTRRYLTMIVAMFVVMSMTPVSTSTEPLLMALMGLGMGITVVLPFLAQKYLFREDILHIRLNLRHRWNSREVGYVVFAALFVPFWLGLYFFTSDASSHWQMETPSDVVIVFISIMAIGVWEELVFIAALFGLLRRYLPYAWANLLQATFFTAFLYQIGFQGWIAINLFLYALYQGMVYYRTGNLMTTLIIHALVDLAVFATIFFAVYPPNILP